MTGRWKKGFDGMGEAIFIFDRFELGVLALAVGLTGTAEGREVVLASTMGVGVSGRDGSMDANRGEVLGE